MHGNTEVTFHLKHPFFCLQIHACTLREKACDLNKQVQGTVLSMRFYW